MPCPWVILILQLSKRSTYDEYLVSLVYSGRGLNGERYIIKFINGNNLFTLKINMQILGFYYGLNKKKIYRFREKYVTL